MLTLCLHVGFFHGEESLGPQPLRSGKPFVNWPWLVIQYTHNYPRVLSHLIGTYLHVSQCNYLKVCLCSKYALMCPASRNRTSAPGHISVRSANPSLGTYASSLAQIAIIRDVSKGTVKFRRWVHSSMIPCMNSTASSSRQRDTLSLTFSVLETNIIHIFCKEVMSICYLNSNKYSLYRLHKMNQHHGETNTSSFGQEIPPILWTLKVRYCVHPPCHFFLSKPNEFSPHPPTLFKINCNIIFQSMRRSSKWFLFLKYCHQEPVRISSSCSDHLRILDLITETVSGEYESWSSS